MLHTSQRFVGHTTHSRNVTGVRRASRQHHRFGVHVRLMRGASGELSQLREPEHMLHAGPVTQK